MSDKKPIDPQFHLREMWRTGPKLAQAKANRVYLEEYRKTLKAVLMQQSDAKTAVDREADAYAHVDYFQHLQALRAAVEEEERLRWVMVTHSAAVEVWRSQSANERGMVNGAR